MGENAMQKQSWAEKPFLERLGIVLGILASVAALVALGYFMVDRYGSAVPVNAAEMMTGGETSTEVPISQGKTTTKLTAEQITTSTLPSTTLRVLPMQRGEVESIIEQFCEQAIAYGKSIGLRLIRESDAINYYGSSETYKPLSDIMEHQTEEGDYKRLIGFMFDFTAEPYEYGDGTPMFPVDLFSICIYYEDYRVYIYEEGLGEPYAWASDCIKVGIKRYKSP